MSCASSAIVVVLAFCYTSLSPVQAAEPILDLPTGSISDGSIAFKEVGGLCGNGEPAYYGYIGGDTSSKKFFIEIMGGAICFNEMSCQDDSLSTWMGITKYLQVKMGMDNATIDDLKSGQAMNMTMMDSLNPGYFPTIKTESDHPMKSWPGIFFPTCTGDIMMGRHNLTYGENFSATHHGAINLNRVLSGVLKAYPDLEEITLLGGSGGGVSTAVWMSRVATLWPTAKVNALVDSGFHMMPGSSFFDFYYNNVLWSNGPAGENAGKIPNVDTPALQWMRKDAIVQDLWNARGRLRVAYIACTRDQIVLTNRLKMSQYSAFNGTAIDQLNEMWDFLTNLAKCAPEGTASSYIMDCTSHHLTQGGIGSDTLPGQPDLKTFVRSFLANETVNNTNTSHLWHTTRDIVTEGGTCPAPPPPEDCVLPTDVVPDLVLPTSSVSDGHIAFKEVGGSCGNGEPAYYGYIGGDTSVNKVFIEIMGGAVCFNETSCQDDWLGAWMGITKFLKDKLHLDDTMIAGLKNGQPLPMSMMGPLAPGYFSSFKLDSAHRMKPWPGVYFPTCTGDIMMGRHTLAYGSTCAFHHGALNLDRVLSGIRRDFPDLEEITLLGGSGGGVATAVWMHRIAAIWPTAKVNALVDSGFHMMPGSSFFDFYYYNVLWSNGPSGQNAGRIPNVDTPAFQWMAKDAIVRDLWDARGRLRVAYIACSDDIIVAKDRARMSQYSAFNGSTIDQETEMWGFLTNLAKCAPEGTAFSYIMNCSNHHLTRGGIVSDMGVPGQQHLKTFVENFLEHADQSTSHIWPESRDIDAAGGTCNSPTAAPPPTSPPARPALVLPSDKVEQGNINFEQVGGICGNGEDAYYGYIGGNTSLKKFFIEIMGGAVCFNKTSCEDTWLGAWMGITPFLKNKLHMDDSMIAYLKSGSIVPMSTMKALKPGYFSDIKADSSHPMNSWPGIFFPTCSADIMMGHHDLTYKGVFLKDDIRAHHHGALNLDRVLEGIRTAHPDLEEITIFGGSGGGVTSAVWMSRIAEIWPSAQVNALVDSGFHMMPGSTFFDFYYNNVEWSNGPGGNNAGRIPDVITPAFAWENHDAIVRDLNKAKDRLRIAYIACSDDHIVRTDRVKMSQYSVFNGTLIDQMKEMWAFLTNLAKCAPVGKSFSYVMNCTDHHLTRGGIGDASLPDEQSLKTFVVDFLSGEEITKPHLWYTSRNIQTEGGSCPSADTTDVNRCDPLHVGLWLWTLYSCVTVLAILPCWV